MRDPHHTHHRLLLMRSSQMIDIITIYRKTRRNKSGVLLLLPGFSALSVNTRSSFKYFPTFDVDSASADSEELEVLTERIA
jgi:hypothetical protein